ncbi:MAG: hypothetical protein ACI92G_000241 [Candidatus Pelagisphaera sp.]|jgi:hypothetical protein
MKLKTYISTLSRALALLVVFSTLPLVIGNDPSQTIPTLDGQPSFGHYVAINIDAEIVKDVKVNNDGRIYLLLNPDHKEKEIVLKNSMSYQSGYRKWFNGQEKLISPANQGKAPNEYTDWVETTANYIEYYMDGNLILHLGKQTVLKP